MPFRIAQGLSLLHSSSYMFQVTAAYLVGYACQRSALMQLRATPDQIPKRAAEANSYQPCDRNMDVKSTRDQHSCPFAASLLSSFQCFFAFEVSILKFHS